MEKNTLPLMSVAEMAEKLSVGGYYADPLVAQAAAAGLLPRPDCSIRTLFVSGSPGTGKSALATALATAIGAELVVYQFHAWTDSDELFVGVNVPAAGAGEAQNVRQSGALLKATEISQERPCVLLLDEIDKAPERAENLLLDWLQSGRCPIRPGVHHVADASRLIVLMTSNGKRAVSEALRRRTRLLHIQRLTRQAWCAAVSRMIPLASRDAIRLVYNETSTPWTSGTEAGPAAAAAFLTEALQLCGSAKSMQDAWKAHLAPSLESGKEMNSGPAGALWALILASRQKNSNK